MAIILIVDADADFSLASEALLAGAGHTVLRAETAGEAESVIRAHEPDLVLLDVMLEEPDDGIALAGRLIESNPALPVIIVSGVGAVTGYGYRCGEMMPCADFLEKPVDPALLLERVGVRLNS